MSKLPHKPYSDNVMLAALTVAQLIVLGYQVRTERNIALPRHWALNAAAPFMKGIQRVDAAVVEHWERYSRFMDGAERERTAEAEMTRLRLENQWLRQSVRRFGREAELIAYQRQSVLETDLARVVAGGSNPLSKEFFLDRGRKQGIRAGMAVINADGIVGKVQAAYATVSLVLLVNDAESGVGVVLENSFARGVLKGTGGRTCMIDYILPETKVRPGDRVFTSGDDRVFPRGLPVGRVARVAQGVSFQDIAVELFAAPDLMDEALIVTRGVHMELPREASPDAPGVLTASGRRDAADADPAIAATGAGKSSFAAVEADRVKQRYRRILDEQGTRIGSMTKPPPDFGFDRAAPPPADSAADASASAAQEDKEKQM